MKRLTTRRASKRRQRRSMPSGAPRGRRTANSGASIAVNHITMAHILRRPPKPAPYTPAFSLTDVWTVRPVLRLQKCHMSRARHSGHPITASHAPWPGYRRRQTSHNQGFCQAPTSALHRLHLDLRGVGCQAGDDEAVRAVLEGDPLDDATQLAQRAIIGFRMLAARRHGHGRVGSTRRANPAPRRPSPILTRVGPTRGSADLLVHVGRIVREWRDDAGTWRSSTDLGYGRS